MRTPDVKGLKMTLVNIILTAASSKLVCAHSFMHVFSRKKSFNSLTGAILPKVKVVLLWTDGRWKACICLPQSVEVFIPLITTHKTATTSHHNTHAYTYLIPVIHQWTSLWSSKLISQQFNLDGDSEWEVSCVCVLVCLSVCAFYLELRSSCSP